LVSAKKKKIVSIIYDNVKDKIIDMFINKATDYTSLILPNLEITKVLNLPIIELVFKMKFIFTVIIILL
jgi:hypothetical protein